MKRRKFVKSTAVSVLLAPFIVSRKMPLYANSNASSVVSISDQLAARIDFRPGANPNSDDVIVDKILDSNVNHVRVMRMVDTAVMKITGHTTVGEAWESLFPAGHPNVNTKIGIKLNFSYGDRRNDRENDWSKTHCPFGPKAAVTNAIVTGLTQMLNGTFPVENITLIESMYSYGARKDYPLIQGYRSVLRKSNGLFSDARQGASGIHWIHPRNSIELPPDAPKFVAAPDYPERYQAPQRIYKAVYENDFMINYVIAKDHRASGITGAMKNNYGCADNPVGTHGSQWNDDDSPYAGTRLCVPVFYKNIDRVAPYILNVLDALTTVYEGGPMSGKVYQTNKIAVSTDPVAIDAYQLKLINEVRNKKKLHLIGTEDGRTPDGHPNASFLHIAVDRHQLGNMSMDNLQSYDLSSIPESMDIPILKKQQSRIGGLRMAKDKYKIQVFLDNSNRKHLIESRIEDLEGNIVKAEKTISTRSSKVLLSWDHRNNNRRSVKNGIYIWYITVDGMLHSSTIVDVT